MGRGLKPDSFIKHPMRLRTIFALLVILTGMAAQGRQQRQGFDKSAFYAVMASGNLEKINDEIATVTAASIPEKEAYEGALLMKKAGLLTKASDKLKFFKSGRIKLESALLKDSTNGEYHFLRLTVQEHAPKVVKYSKNLKEDSHYIHTTFNDLTPVVQKIIIDYSKNSKTLRPEDFHPENL